MIESHTGDRTAPPPSLFRRRGAMMAGIALAALAVGAAAGAGGTRLAQRWQPQSVMLLQPGPISAMQPDTPVAVKGAVAEIFGNKFIMQDASGRTLVDLGPRGDDAAIVAKDEAVTVQGRFDRGVVHAQVVVHADGRSEAFGPPKPPRPDRGPAPLAAASPLPPAEAPSASGAGAMTHRSGPDGPARIPSISHTLRIQRRK